MEQTFGHEGNLADQGYSPMPEPPKDEEKIYNGDSAGGVREAANDLAAQRVERMNEPGYKAHDPEATIDRPYIWRGGEHDGEPVDPRQTIDLKRAAHDLTERRTAEAADAARQIAEAIGSEVDSYRAAMSGQPQPEPQPQPQPGAETTNAAPIEPQPQPEMPLDNGIDPELQRALENPKIRALLEYEAQASQHLQQGYAQATQQAAQVAAASVLAAFPELQGLNGDQLIGAVRAIGRQNPQRAMEIRSHLERVQQLSSLSAQAQAQQQQRASAQFYEYARQQDQIFDDVMAKESPETLKQIKEAVPKVARERYGVSTEQLAHLLTTRPLLRSAPFQLMMADAVKYHLAKEASARPAPRPLPPVQRPGSGDDIAAIDYSEVSLARQHFNKDPNPRTAAKTLIARRPGGRGGSYNGV